MKTPLKITLLFLFLLSSQLIYAQPEFDDDIADTPIDGITSLLVVSALSFGAGKFRKDKQILKQSKQNNLFQ
jgi:hypothetical protein